MNKRNRVGCCTVLSLLLAATVGASAQQSLDWGPGQRSSQSRGASGQMGQRGNQVTLSGTIDSIREANLVSRSRGYRSPHYVARLETDSGQTHTVDLGPTTSFQDVDLQTGDDIRVQGRYASIGGRRILMADQVRANGEIIRVNRQRTQARRGSQQAIQGRIDKFRHLNLRSQGGQRQEHSLVRLKLQDGRTAVVDLGRKVDLEDLDLQKGDRIRIRGTRGTIDGRPALMANQIQVGGETISIQRPRTGSGRQGSQGQTFTVTGRVNGYQILSIGAGDQERVLLNLRLNDGRSLLVDSSDYSRGDLNLRDLDIGDRVVIRGHTRNLQGKTILLADDIRFQETQGDAVGRGDQGQTGSGRATNRNQNSDQNTNQGND